MFQYTLPKGHVSIDDVMSWEPCADYPRERVAELFAGRDTLTVHDVLALDIPVDDVLWAALRTDFYTEGQLRCLAAAFAESMLPRFEAYYPGDNRPRAAIMAARDYAHGRISAAARAAARAAAWDAARAAAWDAARAAEDAAWDAAWDAARAAAWAAEDAAWAAGDAAWDAAWAAAWAAAAEGETTVTTTRVAASLGVTPRRVQQIAQQIPYRTRGTRGRFEWPNVPETYKAARAALGRR